MLDVAIIKDSRVHSVQTTAIHISSLLYLSLSSSGVAIAVAMTMSFYTKVRVESMYVCDVEYQSQREVARYNARYTAVGLNGGL